MIKKFLLIPLFLLMLMFSFVSSAEAYIQNEVDLANKIRSLQTLRDADTITMINKAELIGYRLEDFNSARMGYNSAISYAIDQLYQIQNDLAKNELSGLDENAKLMQKLALFQRADTVISNLNTQTNMYMETIRYPMPILTYEKYRKKFWNFYNSLGF